jgi:hypothetical protein
MSNLTVALEFSAIDHATATARLLAQSLGGVGKAAHLAGLASSPIGKLTQGLGQVGVQLSSIGSAQDSLDGVSSTLKDISTRIKEIAGAGLSRIGTGLSKLGTALPKTGGIGGLTATAGGVAAAVGGGFEVHEILQDNEFFSRLRINTGAPIAEIEALRHHFLDAARDARISSDELKQAFDSLREGGAPIEFIDASLDTIAASIQRLNGHGSDIGELFANLRKFDDLQGPQQLLQAMATLQAQIKGVPGGLEDFVPATAPLLAQYKEMGHAGLEAVKEIGAVYATVAQGTATPRQARSATEGILSLVSDRQSAIQLQGLGVNVFGHDKDEVQRNFDAGKTLPLTEILQSLLKKYIEAPAVFDQVLGDGFKRDFRIPLAETKEQGFSPTLNQKLETTGDPAQFLRQAHEASEGLTGSLNSLNVSLKQVGESVLATPFQFLADGLNRFNGIATVGITVIGGLAVIGTVSNMVSSVGGGLIKFWGALKWVYGFIPSLSGMAVQFAAWSETIAGLVSWSPALAGMFTAMSEGFLAVGLAIEATPIGWIITGIAAIAAAAYLIYEYWTPITSFFGGLWQGVEQISSGAWDVIAGVVTGDSDRAVGGLKEIWGSVGAIFGTLVPGLKDDWAPITAWFGELWHGIGEIFDGGWNFIAGVATGDSERAIGGIEGVWGGIRDFFSTLIRGLFDDTPIGYFVAPWTAPIVLISEHWTEFSQWIEALFGNVESIAEGYGRVLTGIFTLDTGEIVGGMQQIWQGFSDFFSNLWDGIVGTAEAALDKIASFTDILPDWITGAHADARPAHPAATAPALPPAAPPAIRDAGVKAPAPLPQPALPRVAVPSVPGPAPVNLGRAALPSDGPSNWETEHFNYAGLRKVGVPAAGPLHGGFQEFDTPESGVAAIKRQLLRDEDVHHWDDLATIIGHWAPPNDGNDTANLIGRAASIVGVDPGQRLDLHDPATMERTLEAFIRNEQGGRLPSSAAAVLHQVAWSDLPTIAVPQIAPQIAANKPLLQTASAGPNLPTLGPTLGPPVPTAFGRDSVTGEGQAARSNAGPTEVIVRFIDAPRGTRVETNSPPGGPRISVDVGYAFGVP